MPVICPAVLADTVEQYEQQIQKVAHFAHRIHIDLTDGKFAPSKTIDAEDAWWPVGVKADLHLMYDNPDRVLGVILRHQPNMIIIHAEADGNFENLAELCHHHDVKVGVALQPRSKVELILPSLDMIDHVLIFSGSLGKFGGHANLDLLKKVQQAKQYKPSLEVGWDGGVNQHNISQLAFGGVDVFSVGGYIQNADNAEHAYKTLERIAEETGTT